MAIASNFIIGANDEHGLNPPTVGKRTPILPYINRSFYENEFNKQAKIDFILACLRCGFNIVDIHPEINDISVTNRVIRANRANLSLLVTFAYNASGNDNEFNNARGLEVYYSPYNVDANRSRILSQDIFDSIVENVGIQGRFVGTLSVGVLSSVNCPSSLIEAGFMTNFEDAKLMLNPNFTLAIGESSCRGVCEFLDVDFVERSINNYETLRQGDSGNNVRLLQYALNQYGYNLDTDGIFGGNTYRAVLNLQRNNNLVADGIVGRNTWSAILNLNPTSTVIGLGDKNTSVLYLQRLLLSYLYPVGALDGDFGSQTERAVQSFQSENNLVADGIVGPNTWSRLLSTTGRNLP